MHHAHRLALALACGLAAPLAFGCHDDPDPPPDPPATEAAAATTIEIGAYAPPRISIEKNAAGTGHQLRFTTTDAIASPQWRLQRRAGSWIDVGTDGGIYPLGGVGSGTEFRVRVCVGTTCSGFSPTITVTVPATPSPPTASSTWSNPAVGEACEPEPVLAASDWIGTIAGEASVEAGDAAYHVAIELPPGRRGMQPSVALSYGSGNGDGIAGPGWSLVATSMIHRCERIEALDRERRPVLLQNPDRLCVDGQPLVLVSGSYGSNGAIYRGELAKHDRITQSGALNSVLSCFTVETKDGLRRKYGRCGTQDGVYGLSVPGIGGPYPMTWGLVRDEDRQGNTVDYAYAMQSGQHVLTDIRYTGRTGTSPQTGDRRVAFAYADRSDGMVGFRYRGVQERSSRLLTSITTYVGTTPVKRYELAYKTSTATARSLLDLVRMCPGTAGPCDPATSLPPTRFTYQQKEPTYARERVPLPDHANSTARVHADYDGDGVLDRFVKTTEGPWGGPITDAALELSGFGTTRHITIARDGDVWSLVPGFHHRIPGTALPSDIDLDFDQDGRADLIGKDSGNNFAIASWNGTAFEVLSSDLAAFDETGAVTGDLVFEPRDFNGDGKTDLYAHQTHTIHLQCRERVPGGAALQFCQALTPAPLTTLGSCDDVVDLRDWNGDGLTDFLIDTWNHDLCAGAGPRILMSQGRFTPTNLPSTYQLVDLPAFAPTLVGDGARNFRYLDVNGDGLTDIARTDFAVPHVWINRGGTFVSYTTSGRINFGVDPVGLGDPEDVWGKLGQYAVVADHDGDGTDELMVPIEVKVGACTRTNTNNSTDHCLMAAIGAAAEGGSTPIWKVIGAYTNGGGDPDDCYKRAGADTFHEHCSLAPGDTDYAEDGNFYQAGAPRHHTIYRWDAVKLVIDSGTGVTVRQLRTDFEGPVSRTQFADWNGDGRVDGVMRIGSLYGYACDHDDCPLVPVSTYRKASEWVGDDESPYEIRTVPDPGEPPYNYVAGQGLTILGGHGQFVAIQTGGRPDVLTKVENGLGQRAWWDYATLSGEGVEACNTRLPLYTAHYTGAPRDGIHALFSSSRQVVARFRYDHDATTAARRTVPNTSCYHYEDAWWNNQGRGFLGFARITEEQTAVFDGDADVRIVTDYETRFPLAGRPKVIRTARLGDSDPDAFFLKRETTWSADCAFPGTRPGSEPYASPCFVYAGFDQFFHRDLTTGEDLGATSTATYYYAIDLPYGNPSRIVQSRADGQIHTTVTTNTWDYSAASAWWIDRLERAVVTSNQIVDTVLTADTPERTVTNRFVYYPDTDPAARRVQTEYLQEGIDGEALTKVYTYDTFGNPASTVETASRAPQPRTTTWSYANTNGYFRDSETRAGNHTGTTTYDPTTGAITSAADPAGNGASYTYDALGRLRTTTPSNLPKVHERVYACSGTCPEGAIYRAVRAQRGLPFVETFHDAQARVIQHSQSGLGDGTGPRVTVRHWYDARGRHYQESAPSFDPDHAPVTWTGSYDALGRPTGRSMLLDDPSITRGENYFYEGLTTTTTGYDGEVTIRTTDLEGRTLETFDALGNRVRLRYDPLGRLALTEDDNGVRRRIERDPLGRVVREDDPDAGVHTYRYDGFGQQLSHTDARGLEIGSRYDALGRLDRRTVGGQEVATWSYDGQRKGSVDRETAGGHVRHYTYDVNGRISQLRTELDTRSFVTDYGYNCRAQLVSVRYPSGKELGLEYDPMGYRVREVDWHYRTGTPVTLRTLEQLDARGNSARVLLGNGAVELRTHSQATGELLTHAVDVGTTRIHEIGYTYGPMTGLLDRRDDAALALKESYDYDDAKRLVGTTRAWTATGATATLAYAHDGAGRMTLKSDRATSFTYGDPNRAGPTFAGPNGLRSYVRNDGVTVSDFRYDGNGNLTQGDGRTFVYDAVFDLPVSITRGSDSAAFTYDGSGRRVKQVANGVTTYYVGDGFEYVVAANGDRTSRSYGGGAVQALVHPVLSPNGAESTSFLHVDRLGSTELVTPGSGAELAAAMSAGTLERHAYDPFGASRAPDGSNGNGLWTSLVTRRSFGQHEQVGGSQLVHMGGRVFDPGLARFTSVDPVISDAEDAQGYHRYGYLSGNPTGGIDRSGYEEEPVVVPGEEITIVGDRSKSQFSQLVDAIRSQRSVFGPSILEQSRSMRRAYDRNRGGHASMRAISPEDLAYDQAHGRDPVGEEQAKNQAAWDQIDAARWGVPIITIDPDARTPLTDDGNIPGAELLDGLIIGTAYAGHELVYEVHKDGKVTRGHVVSGAGKGCGNLSWPEQLLVHTEPKVLLNEVEQLADKVVIVMYAPKQPCVHCARKLRDTTKLFNMLIEYWSTKTRRLYTYQDGTETVYKRGPDGVLTPSKRVQARKQQQRSSSAKPRVPTGGRGRGK